MDRVAADDAAAFEALYDRHSAQAYRLASAVCRHDALVREAVQSGFLSVWKSRTTYSPQRGAVAPWLLTMVRNRAVDACRRDGQQVHRRALEAEPEGEVTPATDGAEQVIPDTQSTRLPRMLDQMPDAQREVIVLALIGQLSHTEIASQLDLPTGTVKGRMRLGLDLLRDSLESE